MPGVRWARGLLLGKPQGAPVSVGCLRHIVYPPTWLSWDSMKQRPQFLMEAFQRAGHQVWFVDPGAEPSVLESGIRIVRDFRSLPVAGTIAYTHFAPVRHHLSRFPDTPIIYDLLDDLSIYDRDEEGVSQKQTVRAHHKVVVGDAAVVICSNPELLKRHLSERPDLLLVENGVDPEYFRPDGDRVSELRESDTPIVGYHGAIAPWIDFDLVGQVVNIRSDLDFVFVGPVESSVQDAVSRLERRPNVRFIGEVRSSRIAEYVRSFDVGIVPFVVDEMTCGVTPLKMFEYLASGVGVVSTALPASVSLSDVAVGEDARGFAAAIESTLAESETRRAQWVAAGREASWDRRIGPLLSRLDEIGLRVVE